jgi:hypothetical protein
VGEGRVRLSQGFASSNKNPPGRSTICLSICGVGCECRIILREFSLHITIHCSFTLVSVLELNPWIHSPRRHDSALLNIPMFDMVRHVHLRFRKHLYYAHFRKFLFRCASRPTDICEVPIPASSYSLRRRTGHPLSPGTSRYLDST